MEVVSELDVGCVLFHPIDPQLRAGEGPANCCGGRYLNRRVTVEPLAGAQMFTPAEVGALQDG